MARFRHVIANDQWKQIQRLAKQMNLKPREVLNLSSSIGLRFLELSLTPRPELVKALAQSERISSAADTAVGDALKPLAKTLKEKR